ncbi:MAG: hypothetical protein HY901_18325 [Deltaproteobacteria bacterium]|nr:hypothetical protein [Deltaproteobacteria bacterium]
MGTPKQLSAARRAWATRRSPTYKARRTANASQVALRAWARENSWYVVFLDAPSGHPRTGIVDALLVRIGTHDSDALEVRLLQLKGGSAGLKALERRRLVAACSKLWVSPAYAFFDGEAVEVDLPVQSTEAEMPAPQALKTRRR